MTLPLTMVTCYDATFARICASIEGLDFLLVGDSAGMVIGGRDSTTDVSLDQMLYHTEAVTRGRSRGKYSQIPIIADMPIGTYRDPGDAHATAERLMQAGADLVKLEGPVFEQVAHLKSIGLRVCAHIGFTPQSIVHPKVQGKSDAEARRLLDEARQLEAAGAEIIVLELLPASLARQITEALKIPTIGIGAGVGCGGQVLVLYDLLGLNPDFNPKFLKKYMEGDALVRAALASYVRDVRELKFPAPENSFS